MLEHADLLKNFDKDYAFSSTTRERGADDLVFYWVTQWDDDLLNESQLLYRGEFNIVRKAGRDIISNLDANPVQVDFVPIDEDRDDAADLLDGLYRTDSNNNTSVEAFSNASQECVVAGVGAWEIFTQYESIRDDENNNQVIRRRPIYEANSTVYWDANAKLLDKSDATRCTILVPYSEDGYLDLVENLTGERPDSINTESFKQPETSYTFPWINGESKKIYVGNVYHRELVKETVLTMVDPVGIETTLRESDLKDVMDDMINAGFEIVAEKQVNSWVITKYIVSGAEILKSYRIAGEHIPVVPQYGEHAFVEGEEHWEGVTRLAKDPQRLRNFQMSYLADIVSKSPREKQIYFPEQVQGFEDMHAETGADDNYPYKLINRKTEAGEDLPLGPVGMTTPQPIPQALAASIELSRQAVEDVANPGIPQNLADPDLSGKAVIALQNKIDQQSMIYQEHVKHAKRRDGEIYASMARELYDVPRKVMVTKPDGTRQNMMIMETIIDEKTGDLVTLHDLQNSEFQVYSDIGPSYNSKKEQTVDRLMEMIQGMQPGDPMREVLILKIIRLMDGVDFDDVREYANKQLILKGIKEAETPEEQEMIAEEQQKGQQPGADMVLAMAEEKKAQADIMREQRENIKMQLEFQNKQAGNQIDVFKAQTDRMGTQIDAQKAGADINLKNIDAFGKQIDNTTKIIQLRQPASMSDDELMAELMA